MTTTEQAQAKRIAELEAALAAKDAPQALRLKKTEKGGLSVYNLGRFPVTLYREQWERLLDAEKEIREAIKTLPTKAEKDAAKTK